MAQGRIVGSAIAIVIVIAIAYSYYVLPTKVQMTVVGRSACGREKDSRHDGVRCRRLHGTGWVAGRGR